MIKRPIGIFDSGLGGLSVVAEFKKVFKNKRYIYFGDTARVPYGSKSVETIKRFALQDCRFLLSKDVAAIIVACGTVSANAIEELKKSFAVPIVGVVEPTANKAVEIAKNGNGRIAVLGTAATIKSGAYEKAIKKLDDKIDVFSVACPLFVPLVESGYIDKPATSMIAREYLEDLAKKNVDAVILGCTHYPILSKVIGDVFGESVLVNSGKEAADYAYALLEEKEVEDGEGEYYVSDEPHGFSETANVLLGEDISSCIRRVNIEEF